MVGIRAFFNINRDQMTGNPGKIWLTKFETSKVIEGMCPKCNGDLEQDQEGFYFYHCPGCNSYFAAHLVDEGWE